MDPMVCANMASMVQAHTCVEFRCAPSEALMAALIRRRCRAVRFDTMDPPPKGFKAFVNGFVAGAQRVSYVRCHTDYLVTPRTSLVESVYVNINNPPAPFVDAWIKLRPHLLRVFLPSARRDEFKAPNTFWVESNGRGVWAAAWTYQMRMEAAMADVVARRLPVGLDRTLAEYVAG